MDLPIKIKYSFFESYQDETSPFEEARFYVYIQSLSIYLMQRFTLAIVLLIGGAGVLSRFLYEGTQFRALFRWRLMICLLTSLLVLGFSVSKRARRWFVPLYVLEYSIVMFASGYLLVQVQDHENLGIAILITLPLWTVPMPARFPVRAYTVACSLLAIPGVYFYTGMKPVLLSSITLFLGIMAAISIFIGHGIFYRLNRENFFNDRELQQKRQQIEYVARHDQLTELLNRGGFEDRLKSEIDRVRRYEGPLSLIMIDIDHFKKVNDTYGHGTGDSVLETIGELLRQETRKTDITGRIGGEEFTVLLPETPKVEALELAERIRKRLADRTFRTEDDSFNVTCSIGVAEWDSSFHSSEDLLGKADKALYRAKNEGRNRVVTEEDA